MRIVPSLMVLLGGFSFAVEEPSSGADQAGPQDAGDDGVGTGNYELVVSIVLVGHRCGVISWTGIRTVGRIAGLFAP